MKSVLAAAALFLISSSTNLSQAFSPSATSVARRATSTSSATFVLHAKSKNVADRRDFLVAGGMAVATSLLTPKLAYADDVDYKAVAKDIMDIVNSDPDKGPSKFGYMFAALNFVGFFS